MEDLNVIFAGNLISLRTKAGLTQAELGAKLNYSDKSVSKWERAESLPDVIVMKRLAGIFGVNVDYLLVTHDEWEPKNKAQIEFDKRNVIKLSMVGTWTLAMLLFVSFWILGRYYWIILIAAVPASLLALLVLNSLWNGQKHNPYIVGSILLGLFAVAYYALRRYHPWQLVFVLALAELAVFYAFRIRIPRRDDPNDNR